MAESKELPVGFTWSDDDPLAEEHTAVAAWVEEAYAAIGPHVYLYNLKPGDLPTGQRLLEGDAEQSRRYVMAAIAQSRYWNECDRRCWSEIENTNFEQSNCALDSNLDFNTPRTLAEKVARALMKRRLPFQRQDLKAIFDWCNEFRLINSYYLPCALIVKALQRFAETEPITDELKKSCDRFVSVLRRSNENKVKRLATDVEQLCGVDAETPAEAILPPPEPAPVGDPAVLVALKHEFGLADAEAEEIATTLIGPDEFPLRENSPLAEEHVLLNGMLEEELNRHHEDELRIPECEDLEAMARLIMAGAERHVHAMLAPQPDPNDWDTWAVRWAPRTLMRELLKRPWQATREGFFDLLLYHSIYPESRQRHVLPLLDSLEPQLPEDPLSEGERYVLSLYRETQVAGPPLGIPSPEVARLTRLIGDGQMFCLVPGEAWSDAVNNEVTAMSAAEQQAWNALFAHMLKATSSRPSSKWLKTAGALVQEVGPETVHKKLEVWLPLVLQGRSTRPAGLKEARRLVDNMDDENATCLRGLLWLIPTLDKGNDLIRQVSAVAMSGYKKIPGIGPRAVKVGNAAVYSLSQIATEDAVGQLAMLKVRVKFKTAQKEIEKAFQATAEALGFSRDEIEEMGVPSYGLEELGRREETLGDYRAELLVTGSSAKLVWSDAKGKTLKSVPAKVRKEHKEELKELQQALKDIQGMLPAQRDRIDSMFLLQKSWPMADWRERYLDHPLMGTITSRLIWCIDGTPAVFIDGQPNDVKGTPLEVSPTAEVTLWHPVGREVEEITAWRKRLEELQITQPFKQAHREVYLLTDAERNTGTYSNRFAAHVIRQHQFNALRAARSWDYRLRLMVDDEYPPPTRELPEWGLRAEYWVEPIGDDFGVDTNESGVYYRLATDQVRFYRTEAAINNTHATGGGYSSDAAGPGTENVNEPLPLEQIPPLVFSEVMRDVDLFVGVASVGNDPTWQDGGPEGRYREYWNTYSFGELSGTATTRKEVLSRLVPRLKIARQCSFSDRFLIVEGEIRTYKIHLGSGNILMEPNDQYLCIVPDSGRAKKQDELFLPFEGDKMLSIILSKAFLLADDKKIKDPTITSQIALR